MVDGDEVESGLWFIRIRTSDGDGVGVSRGVLNAPVLCFWSFSKSSCSSRGRRGGAGPVLKDVAWRVEVVKRRERMWGRRWGRRLRDIVRGGCGVC